MLLPIIGAGTYPYKETLVESIPYMADAGFILFDSSDNYGNEESLGKVISRLPDSTKDSFIVISKYSNPLISVKDAFELSSSKLKRRPDVYLMHWPFPNLWELRWMEMEDLYRKGFCKAIGVCNFTGDYIKQLLSVCKIKPMINQFECHPMFQQLETQDFCKSEGIQIMSYSPLARMNEVLYNNEVLKNIAQKKGATISQVILAWNIEEGRIPIPASDKQEHIIENYNSCNLVLTNDELKEIDSLESGMRVRYNPDTRFDYRQKLSFLIKKISILLK